MTKQTSKIQVTVETLQRTIIRKRQVHTTTRSEAIDPLQFHDVMSLDHLPATVDKEAASEDQITLENEKEK